MNTEAIAYAEERIQGLKVDEQNALLHLGSLRGGIAEWEHFLSQQAAPESAGDSAALTGDPGKAVPLEIVGSDGTTLAGRGVLLEGQNGRSEPEGEGEAVAPPAPARKGEAR